MYNIKTMLANILTIILILLPQIDALAEEAASNLQPFNEMNSTALYNEAVTSLNADKLGTSKAYVEQSLFLNPFNSDAHKLNEEILDKLSEKNGSLTTESIKELYKLLDHAPPLLIYLLLALLSAFFVTKITKLVFLEKSTFLTQPSIRMQCMWIGIGVVCLFLLHVGKQQSLIEPWACVTNTQTALYTGPSDKGFVQTGSLSEGDCVVVIKSRGDWVSLKPQKAPSGWVKKSDLMLLRGSKFDHMFN